MTRQLVWPGWNALFGHKNHKRINQKLMKNGFCSSASNTAPIGFGYFKFDHIPYLPVVVA